MSPQPTDLSNTISDIDLEELPTPPVALTSSKSLGGYLIYLYGPNDLLYGQFEKYEEIDTFCNLHGYTWENRKEALNL